MPNNIQTRALRLEHDNVDLDRRWSDQLRFIDQTIITPLFEKPSDMGLNWRLTDGLITQWAHDFEDLPEELLWSLAQGGWTIDDLYSNFGASMGVTIPDGLWGKAIDDVRSKGHSIAVYHAGPVYVCQFSMYSGPGLPNGSGMALSFATIEEDHERAMRISQRAERMTQLLDDDYTRYKFKRIMNNVEE